MNSKKSHYKSYQYYGISLGGGKGDKTCLSILEYFPDEDKLFLSDLFPNIKQKQNHSSDSQLLDLIEQHKKNLKLVGVDTPLTLPPCTNCRLKCPGHEKCSVPEVRWMWARYLRKSKGMDKKRPNRMFTPYTERCTEQYLQDQIDTELATDHVLGANRAPLTMRSRYIKKRLQKVKLKEVQTRIAFFRLGKELGLRKTLRKGYRQMVKGEEARLLFLEKMSDNDLCFFYHRDFQAMVKDLNAFDSFLTALACFLDDLGACEKMPKGFPSKSDWPLFP